MMTFEEILERDGKLVYKTKGVSMYCIGLSKSETMTI